MTYRALLFTCAVVLSFARRPLYEPLRIRVVYYLSVFLSHCIKYNYFSKYEKLQQYVKKVLNSLSSLVIIIKDYRDSLIPVIVIFN